MYVIPILFCVVMYVIEFLTVKEPLYLSWVKGKYDISPLDRAIVFDEEDEAEKILGELTRLKRVPINGKVIRKPNTS